jgi:transcriptional regulator with XRE-family HTH domain
MAGLLLSHRLSGAKPPVSRSGHNLGVDDQRIGAAFRAVRIKRGWRQLDVSERAGASPGVVSLIERGHLELVSTKALRRVAGALEIRLDLNVRLPHGELERLVNAGHAALHEALAQHFDALPGWVHLPEVSFAVYGERGVIDILAFHEPTGALLVVELKTELVTLEDLLMTTDVRLRHAARIALERGWRARSVSAWVVVAESDTNRRRARAHAAMLRSAFPADGRAMRAWLRHPDGAIRAISFWANFGSTTATQTATRQRRVRVRKEPAQVELPR